jgi:hypothetical protein
VLEEKEKVRLVLKGEENSPRLEEGGGSPKRGDSPLLRLNIIHSERSNEKDSKRDLKLSPKSEQEFNSSENLSCKKAGN